MGDDLVAVLLNPPAVSTGSRSRNAVNRTACMLGFERVVIVNLCAVPTPTVAQLNFLGRAAWESARPELEVALAGAGAVLAGWGVAGLTGPARGLLVDQVDWVSVRAARVGINAFWMVGGERRHPSRWHQYVSDKYGRTSGGTFDDRIRQVLVPVPHQRAGTV